MLAKNNRFHGHGSLRWVFRKGRALRSRHLMLRYVTNPKRKLPRVAIIVSRKVFKSAVKRNRVRRRLFEIVRHRLELVPGSVDIVITVFSNEVLTLSHQNLEQELSTLLDQTEKLQMTTPLNRDIIPPRIRANDNYVNSSNDPVQ